MESHPQNPEFRNNPENFHPCICLFYFNVADGENVLMKLTQKNAQIFFFFCIFRG